MRYDITTQDDFVGGLNTRRSGFVELDEAVVARNVDITTDGVYKRQGTVRLLTESAGQTLATHFFYSNNGVPLLMALVGRDVRLYHVTAQGTLTLLKAYAGVFFATRLPQNVTFTSVPGVPVRVLLLTTNYPAVQLTLHEFSSTTTTADNVISFPSFFRFTATDSAGKMGQAFTFVERVYFSAAVLARTAALLTATVTGVTQAAFRSASLIMPTLNRWAEADAWRADNFHTVVPRLHTTSSDATIQVPLSVLEDSIDYIPGLPSKAAPYQLLRVNARPFGFSTYMPGSTLNYAPVNGITLPINLTQTLSYTTYAFTDGTKLALNTRYPYRSVTLGDLGQGSAFITFGEARPYVSYTIDTLFNMNNSGLIVPGHVFETGDVVNATLTRGNGLDQTGSSNAFRWVKKVDDTRFDLYTNATLTTKETSGFAPQLAFNVSATSAAGVNQIVALGANIPTGTPVEYIGTSLNNIGIPNGKYHVTNLGLASGAFYNYSLHYDPALQYRVQTMSAPIVGNGGQFTVPLKLKIERLVQDNLYVARARQIPFNDMLGVAPANARLLLRTAYTSSFVNYNTDAAYNGTLTGYSNFYATLPLTTPLAQASPSIATYYYVHTHATMGTTDWSILFNVTPLAFNAVLNEQSYPENLASATYAMINGAVIPVAGYGRFANFSTNQYPNLAVVYNNRLVMSGMPSKPYTLVFSCVDDRLGYGTQYGYMQLYTNQDVTNAANPFDIVLSDAENAPITSLQVWQDQLFVFTSERGYQVTATSPTQRNVRVLSGNGAVNAYCTTISDSMLYFASRNGVYAVPLLDGGQFRSGEVSVKVSNVVTNALMSTPVPFLLYNNDDTTLSLFAGNDVYRYNVRFDNWTVYDSTLGFNTSWACVVGNAATWVCNNKLGTLLIAENGKLYADFAAVASPTAATVVACTSSQVMLVKQRVFTVPWRMSTLASLQDVRVWQGGVELAFNVQFRKVNEYAIEIIDAAITSGTFTFSPQGGSGDWFGAMVILNGWQVPYTFGALTVGTLNATYVSNLTTSSLGISLAGVGAAIGGAALPNVATGYVYVSEYKTGLIASEALDMYKRCESASVLLAKDERRADTNARVPQHLLNDFINVNAGAVAAMQVTCSREGMSDLFTNIPTQTFFDDFVLYRDRVNLLGYAFALSVVSQNGFTYKLIAWSVDIDIRSGTGQTSGGR